MKFLRILASVVLFGLTFTACSDDSSDGNPFDQPKRGEFYPQEVKIRKCSSNRDITESWTNIKRNADNKVTSYSYSLNIDGADIAQSVNSDYTLTYYKKHSGNDGIRTKATTESTKNDRGIIEKYTEEIQENITINGYGYIERIETTTDHYANNSGSFVTTTSERTFSYDGDLCKSSTYRDEEYVITYNYKWKGYMLTDITILKENRKDGSIEYNTYEYTFDKKAVYPYSGSEIMPFAQAGIPQIYASMGYFGKCTPYILTEEVQGGYTKFGNLTSNNIKVHNSYYFDGDPSLKLKYYAASNIYD